MQTDLFNQPEPTGQELRDIGIKKSVDNADNKSPKWSDQAYYSLTRYIKQNKEFMTEDFRDWVKGSIPEPPSNRAFGGVIVRAVKNKLIERKGFRNVKNAKAHCTPASVWGVIN